MSAGGKDDEILKEMTAARKRIARVTVPSSTLVAFEVQERLNKLVVQATAAPALAAMDRLQKQLAASAGVASTVERLQQQLAASAGVGSIMEGVQKQLAASSGVLSIMDRIKAQQSAVSSVIGPFLAQQAAMKSILSPLSSTISRLQDETASSLNVAILTQAKWQADVARLAMGPEVGGALRQIAELASIKLAMPTSDGVDRLADLIDAGEIDGELVDEAEQSLAIDTELSEAIDRAADALAASRPLLTRNRARQLVVVWVWLMYGAGLWAVAVFAPPALVAVPAALGAPAAPQTARAVADKLVPRRDDEA